uniref:Homing endonuclease LAGLIDADG domain-containing protein n=1 Tax=Morchella brunnea TaxID=1174671 RepID=A0A8K1I5P4_9PEZI|nr:hypothetical protein LK370_mgp030 [Morchella brunnea]UBU98600.1 hypothetical protein [Morchella brunnea]
MCFFDRGFAEFLRLMTIFNGNLSTNYKKEQFKVWLDTFNLQYKMDIPFIDKLVKPSLYSPLPSNFLEVGRKGGGVMVEFTGRPAGQLRRGPVGFPTPKDVLLGPWS